MSLLTFQTMKNGQVFRMIVRSVYLEGRSVLQIFDFFFPTSPSTAKSSAFAVLFRYHIAVGACQKSSYVAGISPTLRGDKVRPAFHEE